MRSRYGTIVALALLPACSTDTGTGPDGPAPSAAPAFASSMYGCTSGAPFANFCLFYDPPETITLAPVGGTGSAWLSAVSTAAAAWSGVVPGIAFDMLPLGSSPDIEVRGSGGEGGALTCGVADLGSEGSPPTYVATSAGGCGTALAVAYQEFSAVMGFADAWEKLTWGTADTLRETVGHCTFNLRSTMPTAYSEQLCAHEIEIVRFKYGLRSVAPALNRHIVTGIAPPSGTFSVAEGGSTAIPAAVLRFHRANGSLCGLDDEANCGTELSIDTVLPDMSWSAQSPSLATIVATSTGATVSGLRAGTASFSVTYTHQASRAATYNGPASFHVTVTPAAPAAPPTALLASGVTSTGATVAWTAGDDAPGVETRLEYRAGTSGTWTEPAGSPYGSSSAVLSGLSPSTTYAVRIWHERSGLPTDTLTLGALFTTAAGNPPPTPASFAVTACNRYWYGGKYYLEWTLGWPSPGVDPTIRFEVGESTTPSPAGASILATGPAKAGGTTRTHLDANSVDERYFHLRFVRDGLLSPWVSLAENPLDVAGACPEDGPA